MLFNSLSFLLFFALSTAAYFLLPHRARWFFLLLCSCIFYALFIPAYLLILLGVILIDYVAALLIAPARGRWRGMLLVASLVANVGVLSVFKYFDFANQNLAALADFLHWHYPVRHLGMLLPIGLSFHTFQSMAYTIEVYRGRVPPERHLGIYALYVMFYPQLVAGPIERPQNLLNQLHQRHDFDADRVFDGLKQMLFGFFKKVVIADRMSAVVDAIYANPNRVGGAYLILATWFFAIQIYCDFAGYTDIAIGAARVLGFRLMTNFDRPYASQSVAEFWRRWHISLSSWFRDYVYIPLGGSRVGVPRWCLNVMIVFLLSGLWHGASWTFVIWGALHGTCVIVSRLTAPLRKQIARAVGADRFPAVRKAWGIMVTFNLVALAWVFFRAPTLADAVNLLRRIPRSGFWTRDILLAGGQKQLAFTDVDLILGAILITLLFVSEWLQGRSGKVRVLDRQPAWLRWPAYYVAILTILLIGALGGRTFIYFQF